MFKDKQVGFQRFIDVARDPQTVKRIVIDPKNVNKKSQFFKSVFWNDLSLVDGFSAPLIFFSTLDQMYPSNQFNRIAHTYVLEIKESLEKNGLPQNHSLFSGTAGLCYALAFASKGRSRYLKILTSLEHYLSDAMLLTLIPQMQQSMKNGIPIHFKMYDLISGFTGIGLYFLQNNVTQKSDDIIRQFLHLSVQITLPINHHNHLVPGWICPAEFLHKEEERLQNPLGILNMGLAHGVPSLLGFMSMALKKGIEVPGQIEAMQTIIQWLKSKLTNYEDAEFFRPHVTFEQQINHEAPTANSSSNREAWCYGTPGVARILYLAGNVLKDQETIRFAEKVFVSIFDRQYGQMNLPGPTFCHGTAGLLCITQLMARDLENHFLFSQVDKLQKIILNFQKESYPFGFCDLDLCKDGSYYPVNKISLLTGATGVWLSLLSTKLKRVSHWSHFLMIDYV